MTREEMIRKIWREEYMSEPKIDDLIDRLLNDRREFGDVWVTDADARAIAAALRRLERLEKAGQAMYDDKVTDIISVQGRCDSSDRTPAMEAWDAATEESEL